MAKIITAPDRYDAARHFGRTVFLAGAIDMGAAVNWQAEVIDRLADMPGLVIFNPRRPFFAPDMERPQIKWELDHLENAECIFMWFPKDAKAPISFFEAGLYLRTGRLLVGAEEGFYRRANLELTCHRYGLSVYPTLESMIGRFRVWLDALEVARA